MQHKRSLKCRQQVMRGYRNGWSNATSKGAGSGVSNQTHMVLKSRNLLTTCVQLIFNEQEALKISSGLKQGYPGYPYRPSGGHSATVTHSAHHAQGAQHARGASVQAVGGARASGFH